MVSELIMFKHLVLITNSSHPKVMKTLEHLTAYLKDAEINFILNELTPERKISIDDIQRENNKIDYDLVIAIGGDGTMLSAVHLGHQLDIPVLGINSGHLGFLADLSADSMEKSLAHIFAGNFCREERFMLDVEVFRKEQSILKSIALNDIVLQRWNTARLIELETYVDKHFVHRQRSDGLIVCSPTGSTAYALSGGGPILQPSLDAFALVPICPHSLTNRPIIIDGNSIVEIAVSTREAGRVRLTCDGDIALKLEAKDRIYISKQDRTVCLIHPDNHDHFNTLRVKLHWGTEVC